MRISELERTLSSRPQTRPISFAASDSSLSDAEPSDGMLRLIADLKSERDELKRDFDGWLAEERRLREDLEKSLDGLSLFKTPTPVGRIRRMMSIDSMSSATDVDSLDEHTISCSELKAVQEVDEDEAYSEHETNLFDYEDEEEGDEIFTLHRGSSIGSLEDIPCVRSVSSSPSIRHHRHPRLTQDRRLRHVSDPSRQKPRLNRRDMPPWKLSDSSDASKI